MQVHAHDLEAAGLQPKAALLVDHLPRWEVVGQQSSGRTRSDNSAQSVEDLLQAVLELRGGLSHEDKVPCGETPLFIADINRIRLSWHCSNIRICTKPSRGSSEHILNKISIIVGRRCTAAACALCEKRARLLPPQSAEQPPEMTFQVVFPQL